VGGCSTGWRVPAVRHGASGDHTTRGATDGHVRAGGSGRQPDGNLRRKHVTSNRNVVTGDSGPRGGYGDHGHLNGRSDAFADDPLKKDTRLCAAH
jgi:hypothetical protein